MCALEARLEDGDMSIELEDDDLLEQPQLARIYAYLYREGEATHAYIYTTDIAAGEGVETVLRMRLWRCNNVRQRLQIYRGSC